MGLARCRRQHQARSHEMMKLSFDSATEIVEEISTRAVLRLIWPFILLQSARDRVATAAESVTA